MKPDVFGDTFYFVAQTGQVANEKPRTNFYAYRLGKGCLPKVWLAVRKAKVGSGGLVYPREFLQWLAAKDQGSAPGVFKTKRKRTCEPNPQDIYLGQDVGEQDDER